MYTINSTRIVEKNGGDFFLSQFTFIEIYELLLSFLQRVDSNAIQSSRKFLYDTFLKVSQL